MQTINTTKHYRDWIRDRTGPLHKVDYSDKNKYKTWKINQNAIRESFIDEYILTDKIPNFMVTRNYYYDQYNRKEVVKNNDRFNKVLEDFFNPRNVQEYKLTNAHFIERHEDKFIKIIQPEPLWNTGNKRIDNNNWEVKRGSYHVHTLISDIDQKVLKKPNKNIRRELRRMFGPLGIPQTILNSSVCVTAIITILIERALRNRCNFIGHSKNSLDIKIANEYKAFDGYSGWKGMVAYVTKMMYNVNNICEVYDLDNDLLLRKIS